MGNPNANDAITLADACASLNETEIIDIFEKIIREIYTERKTDSFRGGLWPSNILLTRDGTVNLGKGGAIERDTWSAEQLEFLAPETFWSGENTPRSDVYAIGLLLYYCFTKGRLPFQEKPNAEMTSKDRAGLLRRRMNGENIEYPENLPTGMDKIISKALSFTPSERYENVLKILPDIIACRINIENKDNNTSSAIFSKSDENLTEIEKMMLGIINSSDNKQEMEADIVPPENKPIANSISSLNENNDNSYSIPKASEMDSNKVETTPIEESRVSGEANNKETESSNGTDRELYKNTKHESKLDEEKNTVVQMNNNSEKSKALDSNGPNKSSRRSNNNHAQNNRTKQNSNNNGKKHNNSVIALLIICAGLIILALVISAITKHNDEESTLAPMNTINSQQVTVSPESSSVSTTETPATTTESPTATGTTESEYRVIKSDITWLEAKKECENNGGHLVVINNAEEFQKIIDLVSSSGCRFCWIGCYKDSSGEFVWLNNESSTYFRWGEGEPSSYNTDGSVENYLMLYNTNKDLSGSWVYNDVENDPVSDYPSIYSGNICYVCEFDS